MERPALEIRDWRAWIGLAHPKLRAQSKLYNLESPPNFPFSPIRGMSFPNRQLSEEKSRMSYKLIAANCFISIDTVRNHIRHIYDKLHVHSMNEAVSKAIKQRLV